LVTRTGPGEGVLWVTLDENPASDAQLPRDASGRFVLDLHAPVETWQSIVPLARGLSDAVHTVTLTVASRAGSAAATLPVTVDALVVDRKPGPPVGLLLAGAGITLVWALAWTLARRGQ
jgi:hypothetical protein